jgi:hypothetical protein
MLLEAGLRDELRRMSLCMLLRFSLERKSTLANSFCPRITGIDT